MTTTIDDREVSIGVITSFSANYSALPPTQLYRVDIVQEFTGEANVTIGTIPDETGFFVVSQNVLNERKFRAGILPGFDSMVDPGKEWSIFDRIGDSHG